MSEVDRVAAPIEAQDRASRAATDADIAMLRSDILDKLIERKLILLVAKRAEIEATDFEIDDAINSIAKENKLDVDQPEAERRGAGPHLGGLPARIGEEIVQQKVLNGMVRPRAKVEEAQIRKLYDQRYGAMPASGGEELHLAAHGGRRRRRQARVGRRPPATRCGAASRACAPARTSTTVAIGGVAGGAGSRLAAAARTRAVDAGRPSTSLQPGQVST